MANEHELKMLHSLYGQRKRYLPAFDKAIALGLVKTYNNFNWSPHKLVMLTAKGLDYISGHPLPDNDPSEGEIISIPLTVEHLEAAHENYRMHPLGRFACLLTLAREALERGDRDRAIFWRNSFVDILEGAAIPPHG